MIPFKLQHAVAILSRTPSVLEAWLSGLPEGWTVSNEGPDTWSPHDIVGHMIHGERTDWMVRTRHILAGRSDEPFEPFDRFSMLDRPVRPLAALLAELRDLREANLEALRGLGLTKRDMDRAGLHPDLGPVTLGQLLATWATHDLTHIAQIGRVMAKQYRDAVGPWRAYLPLLDR